MSRLLVIRCLTGDCATIAEMECRAPRIALCDQLEQEFGAGFAERHQAQFVNDQQLVADQLLLKPQEPAPL